MTRALALFGFQKLIRLRSPKRARQSYCVRPSDPEWYLAYCLLSAVTRPFTLVTDKYPGTRNIRGTIEFDTPADAQIGALGIRIPAGAAHTYTTLPALTK